MNSLGNALSNSSALEKQESVTSIAGNYSCLILFDLAWPYTLSQPTHNLASDPSCTCLPRTDFTHRLIKFVVLKPHRGCALLHTECHTHTQLHTIIHSYIQSYTQLHTLNTYTVTHNHTHTHSYTHSYTYTITHHHTHTQLHTIIHIHSYTHSYTYTITHNHTHTQLHTIIHSSILTQSPSLRQSHKPNLNHTHIHSCTETHVPSLTHPSYRHTNPPLITHIYTVVQKHTCSHSHTCRTVTQTHPWSHTYTVVQKHTRPNSHTLCTTTLENPGLHTHSGRGSTWTHTWAYTRPQSFTYTPHDRTRLMPTHNCRRASIHQMGRSNYKGRVGTIFRGQGQTTWAALTVCAFDGGITAPGVSTFITQYQVCSLGCVFTAGICINKLGWPELQVWTVCMPPQG